MKFKNKKKEKRCKILEIALTSPNNFMISLSDHWNQLRTELRHFSRASIFVRSRRGYYN
jgi:hypothetical protein